MISIAHRGYSEMYKDNSVQSIRAAIAHRFDIIEIDIQTNLENTLVLHHDEYCKDTHMMICHMNTEETLLNDIPTLEYIFSNIWQPGVSFLLDLKGDNQTALSLTTLLSKYRHILPTLYITSHNYRHIDILQKSITNVKLGFSLSNGLPIETFMTDSWVTPLSFICINWSIATYDVLQYMKQRGKRVFLFTVHNPQEYQYTMEHFSQYADGIIANILC